MPLLVELLAVVLKMLATVSMVATVLATVSAVASYNVYASTRLLTAVRV